MKILAGIFLILGLVVPGINDIATINKLKREAEEAFLAGNYEKAAEAYTILTDSMGVADDKVLLNHGHALFQNGDSIQAFSQYQRLITSSDRALRSTALNQMGILSNNPQERASALNFFKEAMKADPSNAEARHNYQVLKKELDQEKEQNKDQQQQDKQNEEKKEDEQKEQEQQQNDQQQNQDQQNQDQQKQDQQNEQQQNQEQQSQEQKDQEQKEQKDQQQQKSEEQQKKEQQSQEQQEQQENEGEQQPQEIDPDKLKEMNISEEKARMILEAMRNSEIQYIQQNKRKGLKKPESGKPDW